MHVRHFLLPGVTYTTGLSHNHLHGSRSKTGNKQLSKKCSEWYLINCKIIAPLVIPTVRLKYAKDQCECT